jgi:dienelactone hydrolase
VELKTYSTETGNFILSSSDNAEDIIEPFRLAVGEVPYRLSVIHVNPSHLKIAELTFPSQIQTSEQQNNTVHCEYFQPHAEGKVPGTIVLHILGGDFNLSRLFCHALASKGVASLFLKMPYYGPRRDPKSKKRMISTEPTETVAGLSQAVLDIRRGAAWLATRPEIDAERLGIFGISLGGITAALAAAQEPRFRSVCLMLAGGDLGAVTWEAKELAQVRERWLAAGKTREELIETLRVVDPAVYAHRLKDRRVMMLNASRDEVIPKACTLALWDAAGKPPIHWYSGTHYSVAMHLLDGLHRVSEFFVVAR